MLRDRSWKFCLRGHLQQGAERGIHSSCILSGWSHSVYKSRLSGDWRELDAHRKNGLGDRIFEGSGQEIKKEVAIKCINIYSNLVWHPNLMLLMVPVPLLCTANVYIELKDSTKFWAWKIRTLIRLQKSTSKPEKQDAKNGISSRDQERQNPHLTFHSNSCRS